MPEQRHEYLVHSQWAGWFGGYGSEPLIANEINQRAQDGWRLVSTKAQLKAWYGLSAWPPTLVALRTKLLYVFEREIKAPSASPMQPSTLP